MSKEKEAKKHDKPKFSNTAKDLIILFFCCLFILTLSYFFDVFVFIIRFLERHPHKIIYIDEAIMGLLTLSIGLAIFSWRRWQKLKKETAERLRVQGEIIRLTETIAETERIISKQLHDEIELRKQEEKKTFPVHHKRMRR